MSKLDEKVESYMAHFKEINVKADEDLVRKVAKGLGPSIYKDDASTVSGTDKKELETVKNNFLIKKLGLKDSDDLMKAIDTVIEKYGRSRRNKYRVVVKNKTDSSILIKAEGSTKETAEKEAMKICIGKSIQSSFKDACYVHYSGEVPKF